MRLQAAEVEWLALPVRSKPNVSVTLYGKVPYIVAMATKSKSERLEIRVTLEQKLAIELASHIQGRSISDFCIQLVVAEANRVIADEHRIVLSPEAWDAFQAELARPAQADPRIMDLLSRPDIFVD